MKIIKQPHRLALVFITLLLALFFAATAYAHGVVITYTLKANGEVELVAEFDTGELMADAQVTIYSPEDPLTPWLTGTANAEGRYTFVIDPELPGIWEIQYRKAGHGDIVYLQLDEGMIDLALMDHSPGELLPESPAAAMAATDAENVTETESETGEVAVEEESTEAESRDQTAGDAQAEAKQPIANETETTSLSETGTAAEPESVVQTEPVPGADSAETEAVAQPAPAPANQLKKTGEAVVLTTGGNVGSTGGFTSLQIMLMSASVIWGFVGTALYFSSKRTQDHEHVHDHHH